MLPKIKTDFERSFNSFTHSLSDEIKHVKAILSSTFDNLFTSLKSPSADELYYTLINGVTTNLEPQIAIQLRQLSSSEKIKLINHIEKHLDNISVSFTDTNQTHCEKRLTNAREILEPHRFKPRITNYIEINGQAYFITQKLNKQYSNPQLKKVMMINLDNPQPVYYQYLLQFNDRYIPVGEPYPIFTDKPKSSPTVFSNGQEIYTYSRRNTNCHFLRQERKLFPFLTNPSCFSDIELYNKIYRNLYEQDLLKYINMPIIINYNKDTNTVKTIQPRIEGINLRELGHTINDSENRHSPQYLDYINLITTEECNKLGQAITQLNLAGILHNDLHTGNILVNTKHKCLTIIDFGFASFKNNPQIKDKFEDLRTDILLVLCQSVHSPHYRHALQQIKGLIK